MGIQGLLPLLKSTMSPFHINQLEGCSVAIDAYSWLHKGAFSCSTQLCKGLPTSRHIDYCMHRVNLLRHHGVKPILVFDGGLLPMKIEQENKRARTRKDNLARAIEHESNGNSAAAYECYQKAVDISPSIALELIQVLRRENVSYIVAPYEADAQMTFLATSNYVDAVITEDSDLIPFGCPRIIFKMDKYGQGVEFQCSRLHQNKEISLVGFDNEMLLEMCILSGCDYLQSLPGMGLKRAHALISKFKSYDKVIKHLKYSTVSVPPLYEESFKKAILTFHHQRVYDPITEDIRHLSDLPDCLDDDLEFLGPLIPRDIAQGIAKGDLDPFTQLPFQEESANAKMVHNKTNDIKNFKPEIGMKKLDLPVQKNLLTKYFCFASIEAKRKFRAPRTSPINASPGDDNSSPNPIEYSSTEAASDVKCSSESLLESKDVGNTPANETMEGGFGTDVLENLESPSPGMKDEDKKRSLEHIFLQQPGQSIHNSCQAILKECDHKDIQSALQEKTRTENKKVTVRSSYFQNKSMNKNDQDRKRERLSAKDDVASDVHEDNLLESSRTTGAIRSPYFQQRSENKNPQNDNQESLFMKDDLDLMSQDVILEGASSENNYSNAIPIKRKASPNEAAQRENLKFKNMRKNTYVSDYNHHETFMDTNIKEKKFGSDISHVSHYSDIAEKSMEKFVSVISSFRYSSGSRASGLRAPLKDIQNALDREGSTVGADFSQFAYVSRKQKTAAASRRC